MGTDQDEPQAMPPTWLAVPSPTAGRLHNILAAHQQWVQTAGNDGKRAELAEELKYQKAAGVYSWCRTVRHQTHTFL
jgi:hypothetical protein